MKSHTDRGKHYDHKAYNNRDFHKYKFPALNLNLDELSCAVGSTILKELPIIIKEISNSSNIKQIFLKKSKIFSLQTIPVNSIPSYYFLTVEINCNKKRKLKIIKLLKQNNIGLMKNIEN